MRKVILSFFSVILLVSCNKIPSKPIYEELTIDELEKAMKADPAFGEFYDEVMRADFAEEMSPSQKAKYKGVTYDKIFKYINYLNDDAHWEKMDSIWEKDWKKQYATATTKADSALAYWNSYRSTANALVASYVTAEIGEVATRTATESEWIGYRTVEKTRKYLHFIVNFTLADSVDYIDQIDYDVYWYTPHGYFSKISSTDVTNISRFESYDVYNTRLLPEDRPKKVCITKIKIGNNTIIGYNRQIVPQKILNCWGYNSKSSYEELLEDYTDDEIERLEFYQYDRKEEALKKFDLLCYEFAEEFDCD